MRPPLILARVSVMLLGAGFLGYFLLRRFELIQVYHSSRAMDATGGELGRAFEDITFRAGDGVALNGWFFPANTNSPRRSLVMLFCHGNAGNISHRLDTAKALLATGVNLFLFDYRGYGRSQGRPSEAGTYLDAEAAYEFLRSKGFGGRDIVVFGESLGGGVGTELCVRRETAGLILESTFTSVPDLGTELFPWLPARTIGRIKYDTCRKLPNLHVPVLVMHSRADGLVGFHHAEKNFHAANEPKLLWELQGTHNEAVENRENFLAGLEKFLQVIQKR